jgi:adenylate cyclase
LTVPSGGPTGTNQGQPTATWATEPEPIDQLAVSGEERRAQALARVRSLLLDLGAPDTEIDNAIADDTVDLLMVDRMLVPAERRMTPGQVAERTGIPLDFIRRIWRALGFLDAGDDDLSFTEMDIEALHLFQGMMAMGLVDVESGLQMARVIGSSMARIAEAETVPGSTPILVPSGDSVVDADEFARSAGASLPAMARLLEYVWRRHLQAATRRAMLIRLRGGGQGLSPVTTVGFADMVGYTMLSQHLAERELAAVVSRFEEVAHDIVTSLGGRVVKMIGDEAMFVVPTVPEAARIGLALAEAYADDELLSDVRVALATGPVLVQDGDFYGPVVNLASRLVGIAHPGTVLISDELHTALEAEATGEFVALPLRRRYVKDIGRVQAWKLSRPDRVPGADRQRIVRLERLGEVLRDLDELRGGSDSLQPEGGDAVTPELESPVEGDEGTTP